MNTRNVVALLLALFCSKSFAMGLCRSEASLFGSATVCPEGVLLAPIGTRTSEALGENTRSGPLLATTCNSTSTVLGTYTDCSDGTQIRTREDALGTHTTINEPEQPPTQSYSQPDNSPSYNQGGTNNRKPIMILGIVSGAIIALAGLNMTNQSCPAKPANCSYTDPNYTSCQDQSDKADSCQQQKSDGGILAVLGGATLGLSIWGLSF